MQLRRDVLLLGCMGTLVCLEGLHLMWVSLRLYLPCSLRGGPQLTQAGGQGGTTVGPAEIKQREGTLPMKVLHFFTRLGVRASPHSQIEI